MPVARPTRRQVLLGSAALLAGAPGVAAPLPGRRLRVVIVGAGMAGLVAADALVKQGHEVTVLEATMRQDIERSGRHGLLLEDASSAEQARGPVARIARVPPRRVGTHLGLQPRVACLAQKRARRVPPPRASTRHRRDVPPGLSSGAVYETEAKDAVEKLRERLSPGEQSLLILRIDLGLSWADVARVMSTPEEHLDASTVAKRYQRVKARLRKPAEEAGLLDER